jgi:uncharacterized Zn-finger protein
MNLGIKMAFKDLLRNKWLARILLVSWIVSVFAVIFIVNNLNSIVHGTLYDFGLQFSNDWANPYWLYLNLAYALIGVSSGFAFFTMVMGFYQPKKVITQKSKVPEKSKEPKLSRLKRIKGNKQKSKTRNDNNGTNMIISCPNCKKVFGRPMVMLNFEGGKTRLVNVCPYCNHGLGQADNEKSEPEFHIQGQDETESDQRLESY